MSNCLFCKIAEKKIPAKIVHEDGLTLAFEDISPQAPIHIVVIPKKHIPTLLDIKDSDSDLISHLLKIITKITVDKGISERGFRLVINCNPEGGQTIYHIHFHIFGGRQMHWPPG